MRVLRLWIVIDDKTIYDLKEQQPLILEFNELPVKIVAKNGYHISKPYFVTQAPNGPLYIDVGCEADNGRLWGGVAISFILFLMFIVSSVYIFLILANIPLAYIVYKFFFIPDKFITVSTLELPLKKQ